MLQYVCVCVCAVHVKVYYSFTYMYIYLYYLFSAVCTSNIISLRVRVHASLLCIRALTHCAHAQLIYGYALHHCLLHNSNHLNWLPIKSRKAYGPLIIMSSLQDVFT